MGARFLQGVGGALTSAVILGMIVTMFPEQREQAKAIGVYSFVASAGASIGLLLGGVLTEAISWHWIFFVNLPIGLAAFAAASRLIDNDEGIGLSRGADVPGAVLVTSSLMLGVYTIVGIPEEGWSLAADPGPRRGVRGADGRVRGPPAHRGDAAGAAADLPLAQRDRRQRGPGADGGRAVRDVLPGRAVPAGHPGLLADRGGPGLPAGGAADRRRVAAAGRQAHPALRRAPRADRRA